MRIRPLISWVLGTFATLFIVPFLQTPAGKIAEKMGFDNYIPQHWGPAVTALSSWLGFLSSSPLYSMVAGVLVGAAVTFWLDFRFKTRLSNNDLVPIQTSLRLQFSPRDYNPICLSIENISRWYVLCNVLVAVEPTENSHPRKAETKIWNIFIVFEKEIPLKQMVFDTHGVHTAVLETKDRGPRHAVIGIVGEIGGATVDFKMIN